jgi:ATP-dependent RNA helicase SUPV3L1/SUV3
MRALLALLVDEGGITTRDSIAAPLAALDRAQRRAVTRLGVRIGALDLFMPALLKPEAMRWRAALRAAAADAPMPALPPPAAVVLPTPGDPALLVRLGFRATGPQMIRVDVAERLAHRAHQARESGSPDAVDPALVTSLGLDPRALARLMRDIGFHPNREAEGWVWRGRERRRQPRARRPAPSAFAKLAELKRG